MMNGKAFVSKDLNAKHTKILEDLLKLPENRECADCKSRAPRWASVNLGAFICMQCSGIHRSLGVHISKVRSATLDTWLPEQVAFMKCMGNRRSNEYWEAELPPDYDRSGIDSFIHAKYVNKRWVAKHAVQPNPASYDMIVKSKMEEEEPKSCMQRRARRLSLEEEILTKHVAAAQISPPSARQRGYSLDMTDNVISSTKTTGLPPLGELNLTIETTKRDPYKLPYTKDDEKKPGQISTTPSSWATFDFPACRHQDQM